MEDTEIKIDYEFLNGVHTFTSEDIRDLYSSDKDPSTAFNDVPKRIKAYYKKTQNIDVEVLPKETFGDFLMALRKQKEEEGYFRKLKKTKTYKVKEPV